MTTPAQLISVPLTSGTAQTVFAATNTIVATPRASPASGDVVAQVGGLLGHLQTNGNAASDLHLYKGLLP
jgi:hypothetical protein